MLIKPIISSGKKIMIVLIDASSVESICAEFKPGKNCKEKKKFISACVIANGIILFVFNYY